MASILNVDKINNAAGTSAITIDSNGNTLMPGHILQVVNGTTSTQVSTTSVSYADTGLAATITPSSTSSKVLVFANIPDAHNAGVGGSILYLNIVRGSTQIMEFARHSDYIQTGSIVTYGGSTSYLDSPSTASAITYKVQFRIHASGSSYQQYIFLNNSTGTITLMEIAQ